MDEDIAAINAPLEVAASATPLQSTSDGDLTDGKRCSVQKCPLDGKGVIKYRCSNEGCNKTVHMACYTVTVLGPNGKLDPLPDNLVAHCKKCHAEVLKPLNLSEGCDVDGRNSWDVDGKNGKDDPNTSTKILIDWWMHEGNYEKYRGKNNNGTKKIQYAEKLAQKMRTETSSTDRTAIQVKAKISYVEAAWKKAHEWATSETGVGLQESDDPEQIRSFEDTLLKRCKYYRDLEDIMIDRAANKPKFTSYDLDLDDSDDDADADDAFIADGNNNDVPAAVVEIPRSAAKKRKGTSSDASFLTEGLVESMAKATQNRNENKARELEELKRHNQSMEEMEKERMAREEERLSRQEARLSRKDDMQHKQQQFELKAKMVDCYNDFKAKNMSDEAIIAVCPELREIVEAYRNSK
jgi:hypothetical protein